MLNNNLFYSKVYTGFFKPAKVFEIRKIVTFNIVTKSGMTLLMHVGYGLDIIINTKVEMYVIKGLYEKIQL